MKSWNDYYQNSRCPICNGPIQETDSVCAVCSFPVISTMHGSTEEISRVEEQIVIYRKHYYGLRWVVERDNPSLAAAIGKALCDEQRGEAPFAVAIPSEPYSTDQLTLLKDDLEKLSAECGNITSENIVWMRDVAAVIGNYIGQLKAADVAREKERRLEERKRRANAQKREAQAKWKNGEKSVKAAWENGTALLRVYQSGQLFAVSAKDKNAAYDEKKLWYLQGALLLYSQNTDNEADAEWMRDIALFIIKSLDLNRMKKEQDKSAEILQRKQMVSRSWHYGKKDRITAYAIGMALMREYLYGIPFSMKKEDMETVCDNQKLQYLRGALLMLSSKQIDAPDAQVREDAEWMQDIAFAINGFIA